MGDTSNLSAAQLEEIREAVTRSDGDKGSDDTKTKLISSGGRKYVVKSKSGAVHKRSQKEIRPYYWVRDGELAIRKIKNPEIDFVEKNYPNYPGDPLPTKMLSFKKRVPKAQNAVPILQKRSHH